MKPDKCEIATRLLWLSGAMDRLSDAMREADLGFEGMLHADELAAAANMVLEWSRELRKET